jgi:hypothetical protein
VATTERMQLLSRSWSRQTGGLKNASRYDYRLTISLKSQIGDRVVIDGTTAAIRKS